MNAFFAEKQDRILKLIADQLEFCLLLKPLFDFHKTIFIKQFFQDPNADTEWNDALRKKGILPPKPKEAEITEADLVHMLEATIQDKSSEILFNFTLQSFHFFLFLDGRNLEKLDLDELDELEDSEDEAVLIEYRNKRIAEMKELSSRSKFGYVREITGEEYVNEVSHQSLLSLEFSVFICF